MPSAWSVSNGRTWHSLQESRARMVPSRRCCSCAPTARSVVAVSPAVPMGGATVVAEPWQPLHSSRFTSTLPSTCVVATTDPAV